MSQKLRLHTPQETLAFARIVANNENEVSFHVLGCKHRLYSDGNVFVLHCLRSDSEAENTVDAEGFAKAVTLAGRKPLVLLLRNVANPDVVVTVSTTGQWLKDFLHDRPEYHISREQGNEYYRLRHSQYDIKAVAA